MSHSNKRWVEVIINQVCVGLDLTFNLLQLVSERHIFPLTEGQITSEEKQTKLNTMDNILRSAILVFLSWGKEYIRPYD